MLKAKIAVLVSGGGTNLQALINAQKDGIINSGEIVLEPGELISTRASAYDEEAGEWSEVVEL